MQLLVLLLVSGASVASGWRPTLATLAPTRLRAPGQLSAARLAVFPRTSPVVAVGPEAPVDDLISQIRTCPRDELPQLLAANMNRLDQRIFLRFAELSDSAVDEVEKLQIQQMAELVASTTEMLLQQVDKQVDKDGQTVQDLLRTLALESGEFTPQIPPAQLQRCREAVRSHPELDEGFVATVKAYMKKASDDGMESMVDVLRVLLQVFGAERLRVFLTAKIDGTEGVNTALNEALDARPEEWDTVLKARLGGPDAVCNAEELLTVLQDNMSELVLGMPAGSGVQVVLAEYLSELIGRVRAIAAEE